jgi:GTP-binding protein
VDIAPLDDGADAAADAHAIVEELRRYDDALYRKPRWLVLNKIDLLPEDERQARTQAFIQRYRALETAADQRGEQAARVFEISALSGDGCRELTFAIADFLDSLGPVEDACAESAPAAPDAAPANVSARPGE